jgi:hypothetical protein
LGHREKSCNLLATLFSLSVIHLSNGGLACEESFKGRARFRLWKKMATADNHKQQALTYNKQHSTTRNQQQPSTATPDTLQQITNTDSKHPQQLQKSYINTDWSGRKQLNQIKMSQSKKIGL